MTAEPVNPRARREQRKAARHPDERFRVAPVTRGEVPRCFSWTGCPAYCACLHERWDGRVGVLCRWCSRASARYERWSRGG